MEQVSGGDRVLAILSLDLNDLAVAVNEGLLIEAVNAL